MGHPLRWFVPGVVYEMTIRTLEERFFLRPSRQVTEVIVGLLGRAQALYPGVLVHAFHYLSNHGHLLLSSDDGEALAAWIGYVSGTIGREMNRMLGRSRPFWSRRGRAIPIVDDDAVVARLVYVLGQGCKEGLVASPRDWPGASAAPALLGDMTMRGVRFDRDSETKARRRGQEVQPYEFASVYTLRLSPIPAWRDLEATTLRRRHEEIVASIERDTAALNRSLGRAPVGVQALLAQDPEARPAQPKCSPAPPCHASSRSVRDGFRAAYRAVVQAFRRASHILRRGGDQAPRPTFPPGCFPPRGRFQPATRVSMDWLIDKPGPVPA